MLKRRNFITNPGLSGTGLLLASRTLSMPLVTLTLDPAGWMRIERCAIRYRDEVPQKVKGRFPTSISNHAIWLFEKDKHQQAGNR